MGAKARQLEMIVKSCQQAVNEGRTEYPSLSFEHGVLEAIKWLMEMDAPLQTAKAREIVTWH